MPYQSESPERKCKRTPDTWHLITIGKENAFIKKMRNRNTSNIETEVKITILVQ